jgi:hypothetical protein
MTAPNTVDSLPKPAVITSVLKIAEMIRITKWALYSEGDFKHESGRLNEGNGFKAGIPADPEALICSG